MNVKTILLDENLPQPLRHQLVEHDVKTVGYMGWSGIRNGDLIKRIEGTFDILITGDQNLLHQQNLRGRKVGIIELPYTRLQDILQILPEILEAIRVTELGGYTRVQKEQPEP